MKRLLQQMAAFFCYIYITTKTDIMQTWDISDHKLTKNFEMKNFTDALAFVNKIAELAEEMDHHPDIFIHGYKNVRITLFTHSENKVTELDYTLAKKIDGLRK
jgi:4a-hydroxytetrahydrobiopterin dehydratase